MRKRGKLTKNDCCSTIYLGTVILALSLKADSQPAPADAALRDYPALQSVCERCDSSTLFIFFFKATGLKNGLKTWAGAGCEQRFRRPVLTRLRAQQLKPSTLPEQFAKGAN